MAKSLFKFAVASQGLASLIARASELENQLQAVGADFRPLVVPNTARKSAPALETNLRHHIAYLENIRIASVGPALSRALSPQPATTSSDIIAQFHAITDRRTQTAFYLANREAIRRAQIHALHPKAIFP